MTAQLDLHYLAEIQTPELRGEPTDQSLQDHQNTSKTAFDRLVLERGHKDMILSLIAQHFRDKELRTGQVDQFDIVKGKGMGASLTVFLHAFGG
jgi:hypothetical protein